MPHINWFFISSLTLTTSVIFLNVILLRHSRDKIHDSLLLFNLTIFVWAVGSTISSVASSDFLSIIAFKIGCVGVSFIPLTTVLFICRLALKKPNSIILIFSYLFAVSSSLIILKTDYIIQNKIDPFYSVFAIPKVGIYYYTWFFFWFVIIAYSQIMLFNCYLKRQYQNKIHLRYLLVALLVAYIIGSFNFLHGIHIRLFQIGNFGVAFYSVLLTYAIYRHHIFGLEFIIQKSMLYSLLVAILSCIYFIFVVAIEFFFRDYSGYRSLPISIILAFIIALIFNPLRNKLQAFIDIFIFGKSSNEIAQENELLKHELERSERLKAASTLALGLAHEIRNPLTTIRTFAEFLPEKHTDKDFIDKFSKLIPTEVERINNIIHQLLTFSKPSPPAFKDTNIHGLIKDILGFLTSEFLRKKIKISEDYTDSMLIIKIDPIQIKQALLNIIFNGLDAMPNGGTLSIKTEITNNNHLIIYISDTGCGISKEDLRHIFDPFFTKKDEGTGLGLAITYRIITNHGGTIEAESEIRKGTTFIITLPLTTKISEIWGE